MDSIITFLNTTGKSFIDFSTSMLIQSSVLIVLLLLMDFLLRKKVRAVFLYCIWMLILVKLVLPTTLSSPTGLGYWFGDKVPGIITQKVSIPEQTVSIPQRIELVSETIPSGTAASPSGGASPELAADDTSAKFTVASSPAKASLSWQGFAFLGWLAVVIAMVLLLIKRMFFVRGLLAQSKKPNDSMLDTFERCCKQMRVHRSTFLKLSPDVASPSACGLFRPTILIPQELQRILKTKDLKPILLHELAHIKRGDLWINLIQTILQIAYFYNPLLWVANVIIRKVREQAVDEMVLVTMGEQAEDYPETLLNISRLTFSRPVLSLRLVGVVESKKALNVRIRHMLNRPIPKSAKLGILGLLVVIITGVILLPMAKAGKDKEVAVEDNVSNESQFTAILPNGVEVELVGISEKPNARGQQWWRPDGTNMPEPSYKANKRIPPMASIPTQYIFLAKAVGGEDVSLHMRIYEGFGHSTKVASDRTALCNVRHPNPEKAYRKDGFVKGPVEVGVAQGQWLRARGVNSNIQYPRSYLIGSHDEIVIQPPQPETSSPEMATFFRAIASSPDYEYRLLCTLKNGNMEESMRPNFQHTETIETKNTSRSTLAQTSFNIDRPLDQIVDYELLYRKFDYVRFNNVAFKPGLKSDVKIEFDKPDKLRAPSEKYPTIESAINAANTTGNKMVSDASEQNKPDVNTRKSNQYETTLPNGVAVELVGICEHPSEGKQWWRPDGTPIEADDFRDYDYDDAVIVRDDEYARLLAFKLDENVVQGAGISYSLEDSRESRFAPDYVDRSKKKRRSIQVILAAFPKTIEYTNLRLGIAAGSWKTAASGTHGRAGAHTLDNITQEDVIYHEAREKNGSIQISATHLLGSDYDCRIYARGKDGEVYEPRKYSSPGREMRLCKSEFDIPLEKVKLFHLQARPFQWVTFENVSLKTGKKTDVQVEGEKPKVVSFRPASGSEIALVSELIVTFNQPMDPDQFQIVDASLEDRYKHLSEVAALNTQVIYDPNKYRFTIPLTLPCNWNGSVKLSGFKSSKGVEAEPLMLNYSTLRKKFSRDLLERFEKARESRELKALVEKIKEMRSNLKSLSETVNVVWDYGELREKRNQQMIFKVQGNKQFYVDMSEAFDKPWHIGSDGNKCWFYNEYKDDKKLIITDFAQIDEKNIGICEPFGISKYDVDEAIKQNNLEYIGTEMLDERRCHLVRGWSAYIQIDRATCKVNTWWVNAETYMPAHLVTYSSRVKRSQRFIYEKINQPIDDSEFRPDFITDIEPEEPEPLGDGYETRFVNAIDGSSTGRMSVRWGKRGPAGTSSGGLN